MKHRIVGIFVTLFAMSGAYAEESSLKPQVVAHDALPKGSEAVIITMDAEELSFAAKLTDENRRAFSHRLNEIQRKAVMVAFDNGADADEAVHRMVTGLEMRDQVIAAQSEDLEELDMDAR